MEDNNENKKVFDEENYISESPHLKKNIFNRMRPKGILQRLLACSVDSSKTLYFLIKY